LTELLGGSFATGPYPLLFFFLTSKNLRQPQEQHANPHPYAAAMVAITITTIPTNGIQKVSSSGASSAASIGASSGASSGAETKTRTNKAEDIITIATAIRNK
jgi:hypothetical protein